MLRQLPGCGSACRFGAVLVVILCFTSAALAQEDFCGPLRARTGSLTITSRVVAPERPSFNTTWEHLYSFCQKIPKLGSPKQLYQWGSLDVCVKYHLQGRVDQESMDFLLSRDQIGASGGFYNSDNDQDSSQFGACLTVTTVPAGTPMIAADNDIIVDTFGIGDRRLIAALGTYVPFMYYYRRAQVWSAIYNIDLLQNVTGVARIVPAVSNWATILTLPQDWLASLLPTKAPVLALRQSFSIVRQYLWALTSDNWLPILAQLATNPSDRPTEPPQSVVPIFARVIGDPGSPSMLLFQQTFGNYNGNLTEYQVRFMRGVVQTLFGVRSSWNTDLLSLYRSDRADMSHWTAAYSNNSIVLPASAVELLQSMPFLWVDAQPCKEHGPNTFSVQVRPSDAYSAEGWVKLDKYGLINPSLRALLETAGADPARLTTELVDISLRDLAARIFGSSVSRSSSVFRAVKLLLPANPAFVDYDSAARVFEWSLLFAKSLSADAADADLTYPTMAFSDVLALSMDRSEYSKLSERTSRIMLDLLESLISTAVFMPIRQGRALTYDDVATLPQWKQLVDALNGVSSSAHCPIEWPKSFQNPTLISAIKAGHTVAALDTLFCGRQGWAAEPSFSFDWRKN